MTTNPTIATVAKFSGADAVAAATAMAAPQNDWTLHRSGKYYISKTSAWCYSEQNGYFYFDTMGRVVKQGEEPQGENAAIANSATNEVKGSTQSQQRRPSEDRQLKQVKSENDSKSSTPRLEDGEIGEDTTTEHNPMLANGYVPMKDKRYYYHTQSGYVYDTVRGSYALWDERTKSYQPLQDHVSSGPAAAPESDAMMKLVVMQSKLLDAGSIVLVDASGLTVGRDKAFERRLVLNEMEVSRFHCTIYVNRVLEELAMDSNPETQVKSEGAQTPIKNEPGTGQSEKVDFNAALERAKAIAAKLTADISKSNGLTDANSSETKRNHFEMDDNRQSSNAGHSGGANRNWTVRNPPARRLVDYFFITDAGSTHGTFINGERLSEPKMSSQPQKIQHGDTLTIGSTIMKAHIHTAWSCDECKVTSTNVVSTEPRQPKALEKQPVEPARSKKSLEKSRREELKRLRREALGEDEPPRPKRPKQKYVDRAAMRRKIHGMDSDLPDHREEEPSYSAHPAAVPTPETPIVSHDPGNIGSRMLQKMGWTAGQGLGATGEGRVDPVAVSMRMGRQGLGMGGLPVEDVNAGGGRKETLKEATLRRARERFQEMQD